MSDPDLFQTGAGTESRITLLGRINPCVGSYEIIRFQKPDPEILKCHVSEPGSLSRPRTGSATLMTLFSQILIWNYINVNSRILIVGQDPGPQYYLSL